VPSTPSFGGPSPSPTTPVSPLPPLPPPGTPPSARASLALPPGSARPSLALASARPSVATLDLDPSLSIPEDQLLDDVLQLLAPDEEMEDDARELVAAYARDRAGAPALSADQEAAVAVALAILADDEDLGGRRRSSTGSTGGMSVSVAAAALRESLTTFDEEPENCFTAEEADALLAGLGAGGRLSLAEFTQACARGLLGRSIELSVTDADAEEQKRRQPRMARRRSSGGMQMFTNAAAAAAALSVEGDATAAAPPATPSLLGPSRRLSLQTISQCIIEDV
jgi:hypothetical protein